MEGTYYRKVNTAISENNKIYIREKLIFVIYKVIVDYDEEGITIYSNPDEKYQIFSKKAQFHLVLI